MVSPALEMRSALGGRDVSVCPRSVMLPCPGLPVQAACAAHVVLRTSAFVTAARGKRTSGKSSAQGLARVTLIVAAGVAPTSAFVASASEPRFRSSATGWKSRWDFQKCSGELCFFL